MSSTTQHNRPQPIRAVTVPMDVTHDLYAQPYVSAFRFLHKSGEYLREGTSAQDAQPITVATWAEAVRLAVQVDAEYIVHLKEKRIYFRFNNPWGAPSWFVAAPLLHPSIEEFNHAESVPYEPLADGSQPKTRKQISGAQKRKLYGPPPSYKNRARNHARKRGGHR